MEIVKKSENRESVYELVYEESRIESLISEIIKNCSIRVRGRYRVEAQTCEGAKNEIDAFVDSIGNKIYENVSDIREEKVNNLFDIWRHGDSVTYSFEADALVSPKLVGFLKKLLSGEEIRFKEYELFKERKELFRKDELNQELKAQDTLINQISNFDTERKIKMLNELSLTMKALQNLPAFDYEELSTYYDYADNSISLELVQETIKYKRMK